ncbi:MAG: GAF domain-containing protein [Bacteroidales bacterium]
MSNFIPYNSLSDKATRYQELLLQIEHLIAGESDMIANMSNINAILKEAFRFFWVGFYLVKENQLVLGPFQGTIACTRINKGRGVCGTAWEKGTTIIVPDVAKFDGHIACSSLSRSEIVIPLIAENNVMGLLDIDSDQMNAFDIVDQFYLEKVAQILIKHTLLNKLL